jgi:uncharacterized protein
MSVLAICGALAIGILIGALSGLVGIGGGAFLITALVYFYGMSQKMAQGTSIAILLLPIGLFAFLEYYRSGNVDLRMAGLIAAGFAIGGWVGGMWAQHLPDLMLRRLFAGMLIAIAVKMLFSK